MASAPFGEESSELPSGARQVTPADATARDHALRRFETGDHAGAASLLVPLLARVPPDPVLLRICGMALGRTGAWPRGLPYLARARRLAPQDPLAALWHGIALHAAGRHGDAVPVLETATILSPNDPAALVHLTRSLLALGRASEAEAAARRAVALAPSLAEAAHALGVSTLAVLRAVPAPDPALLATAWLALGRACMRLDKAGDALAALREADALQPRDAEVESELALAEHLCGQPLAATARLRAVLQRDPGCRSARFNLASRLLLEGEAQPALELMDAVSLPAVEPARSHWQAQRVQALVALGRDGAARDALAQAAGHPVRALDLILCWQHCLLARRAGRPDAGPLADRVARLADTRDAGTLEQRIDAHFDLAALRRADGRGGDAFVHWRRGHALLRAAQSFSRTAHDGHLAAITRVFDARRMAEGARSTIRDPAPVFIVGLPRTGTTLLEQILSAHPMVHGAGERLAVRETLVRLTGSREAATATALAATLDEPVLTASSRAFLAELHALAPDAALVLDKMPDNVFQLGFIATLLPAARVICCTRDLRDVGASIFGHRFLGHHPYAHDLSDLGWYMARQQQLLSHWRSVLPQPMLTLDHAEWLDDFDGTLRRVLAFLDLPFDAACQRYFEQDRTVGTASRAQVRQPINRAGVGRWHEYREQLAPMLRELPAGL